MNQIVPVTNAAGKKKEFINYIHYFRGIAIMFVVAGHLLLDWSAHSNIYHFLRTIWENGTVLFIFIAGYLFQYLSKKFEYKSYLGKKLKNVILPYFLVSIPIIIFRIVQNAYPGYLLALHNDFATWSVYKKVIYFYLHGAHMQQLWFVPMIACFYIIAPLLIYIDRHPVLYYSLFIFIGVSFLVEREPFSDILKMFVHFFSVYLFGMFMSRYRNRVLEVSKKYWVPLSLATVAAVILNYIYLDEYGGAFSYIQKMLFCCFFIYWLWRLDKYVPAFVSTLADLSFGIFFLHYYTLLIVKAGYEKIFSRSIPGNLAYWIADLTIVLLGTVLVIKLIKKFLGSRSKYIIGC